MHPGDTLLLADGTHHDTLKPPSTVSGTSSDPLFVWAAHDGRARIDGGGVSDPRTCSVRRTPARAHVCSTVTSTAPSRRSRCGRGRGRWKTGSGTRLATRHCGREPTPSSPP